MKVLSFGLLLDSYWLKNWQFQCIQELCKLDHVELELVILNQAGSAYEARKLPIGFRYLERRTRKIPLFQSQNFEEFFTDFKQIKTKTIKVKGRTEFKEKDLQEIKEHSLDFLLRFGFGILSGEILKLSTYGVWSFHHGNPRKFRGGPPVFWEIFKRDKCLGLILQQLNEDLDAGEILLEAKLANLPHSYPASLEKLFKVGIPFPSIVAKRIINNQAKLKSYPIESKGPIYKVPSNATVIRFLFSQFWAKLHFHIRGLFLAEVWNIGLFKEFKQTGHHLIPKRIKWLKKMPNGEYLADPFWSGKANHIYAEKYSYQDGKAHIVELDLEDLHIKNQKKIDLDDRHLSYPFYFEHDNSSYLLPENYASSQVRLFEIVDAKPIKSHSILEGQWVDPTLFEHEGIWFLFVSPKSQSNERLDLFTSKNLLGPFVPHPLNPIKLDQGNSRPAGPLFINDQGKIIRPAQNSIKGYGASVIWNEILKISKTEYEEIPITEVLPDPDSPYPLGLHTMHKKGDLYLIDGKKEQFVFQSFWFHFKRKFKNLLSID